MKKKILKESLKHRKKDTKTSINEMGFEKLLKKGVSASSFSTRNVTVQSYGHSVILNLFQDLRLRPI